MSEQAYQDVGVKTKASEIGILAEALDVNATVLMNLADRLEPVLGPDWSEPSEKPDDPAPTVSRLAELRIKLEGQTRRLSRLIDRLEV